MNGSEDLGDPYWFDEDEQNVIVECDPALEKYATSTLTAIVQQRERIRDRWREAVIAFEHTRRRIYQEKERKQQKRSKGLTVQIAQLNLATLRSRRPQGIPTRKRIVTRPSKVKEKWLPPIFEYVDILKDIPTFDLQTELLARRRQETLVNSFLLSDEILHE